MIIPGIVSATFKNESPDYVLEQVRIAGLKAIEWSENWHVPAGDTKAAAALAERTRANGIEIAAYGSYYRLGENADPTQAFRPSLQNAAAMQAPLMRIWGGSKPSADLTQEERDALAEEAVTICNMAAESGVKVALEWHKNTVTDTNESAQAFLEAAATDNLYCLWQPTVALNMEQRCDGIDMLESKHRLRNLHVYYWLEGKRRPFAEGLSEWRQYLAHVRADETRYGLLEFVLDNTAEQFQEDASQWIRLLQDVHMMQE